MFFPPGYSSGDSLTQFAVSPAPIIGVRSFDRYRATQVQALDNLSAIAYSHQLKFGLDYRWYSPAQEANRFQTYLAFDGIYGPSGAYNATLPVAILRFANSPDLAYVSTAFAAYAQDTWQVNPRLAVTYGLRWEVAPTQRLSSGQAITGTGSQGNRTAVTLLPMGKPAYRTSWTNLAPRFGIAYQFKSGAARNTALRLGAGKYFDLGQGEMQGKPQFETTSLLYLDQPLWSWNAGRLLLTLPPSPPSVQRSRSNPGSPGGLSTSIHLAVERDS
jgi:outer membrane receptor protein involved in Fe transport